jgi:hypothetical protein
MSKIIKIILICSSVILIVLILVLNIKIHSGPNLESQEDLTEDVICQLNFLEDQLKNKDLANEMQNIFPEGFVFTNALYGLTWCELAIKQKNDSIRYDRALTEARYAYNQIDSQYAKSIFYPGLNPQYGIFYRGWKNYLLAKILACQTEMNESEVAEFAIECEQIANAYKSSNSPYLASYPNSSWPADVFPAIASLQIHDEIVSAKYNSVIINWIEKVKSNLDPDTKLVPHSTNAKTGETIEGARGSSISLILRFLTEIDPEFAVNQFKIYEGNFSITRFGLPAIREYPVGKGGSGDIDSGPVIFDIGFAGTIVAIGTLKSFGEYKTANLLSKTTESFGFSLRFGRKKKFLFGKLPIADAFICWSRVSNANSRILKIKDINCNSFGSILRFHIYSFLIIGVIIILLFKRSLVRLIRKATATIITH